MSNPGLNMNKAFREQWKKKGSFDILHGISENVTLVKLIDTIGNINNTVSIVGNWIFDLNEKNHFC